MTASESQIMANVIASPTDMTKVSEKHARKRVDICRVTVPASPGAAHLLRLTKLRAHDHLLSVKHIGGADSNMDDNDLGIFTPSDSVTDPVAIDANGLADDFDVAGAENFPREILGIGLTNFADFGKPLWEYAVGGPTDEPDVGTEYEIVVTITGDAVGSEHVFIVEYTAGD